MQVRNHFSSGEESTFYPFLGVPRLQNYLTVDSTAKGTKVDNIAFSKTKLHLAGKSSPTRRGDEFYPKPLGFLFTLSVLREQTPHWLFIYLFYKGGPFSTTTAPHSVIPEWSLLRKELNNSFLKKTTLISLRLLGQRKVPCVTVLVKKKVTWATLTAERFLRWHSQDNSFALCCSVPNYINGDTPTRQVTWKDSVALLWAICLM